MKTRNIVNRNKKEKVIETGKTTKDPLKELG